MESLDKALLAISHGCPSGTVIRDPDVLSAYSIDESETTPIEPAAVVRVNNTAQVAHVMKSAHAYDVPVTPRGGGTGRVGGAVPVSGGIVMSFEQMNTIKGIEADDLIAIVEPGVVTGVLHDEVAAQNLFYPPDPNSLKTCEIGGNLATNAGGPRSLKYGVTKEYVLGMEAVLADGTVLNIGKQTVKGVTGYDLTSLVVGSEGTLAIVTEATLKLIPSPERVATLLVFLESPQKVSLSLRGLTSLGIVPRCVELLDSKALSAVKAEAGVTIPEGAGAMLLVEIDGDASAIDRELERCGNALVNAGALEVLVAQKAGERDRLWSARRELSRTLRKQSNNKLSEDIVVPRTRIADLLSRCDELSDEHEIAMPTYGHAGDGNLHVNFLWDTDDERPKVDKAIKQLFEAVLQMNGTLSGEHGIGVLKAPYLPMEQSPALIALQQRIKNVFDPRGVLNPGKIFPADAKRFHGAC